MNARAIYLVLLQASLFAFGAGLVAIGILIRFRFRRWWAYVLTKISLIGIIGIIFLLIWERGQVESTPQTTGYVVLVVIGAIGMTFVAGDLARKGGERRAKEDVGALEKAHDEEEIP